MTDQIPADKVRVVRDLHREEAKLDTITDAEREIHRRVADAMDALLPPPPRPTLADMTLDDQDECAGMQADLAQGDRVVILDGIPDHDGFAHVLERGLDVYRPSPADVTPRPDLPRLEWPGDKKPDPTPALPGGWRLADHKDNGRVIVTNPTPTRDGRVYYVLHSDTELLGFDWLFCHADELTYIDTGQGVEDAATAKAGTVIESADDPRLAALPVGTVLIDCDGESVAKRGGMWVGLGYIPFGSEGTEFGPWTVLHVGQGAGQ